MQTVSLRLVALINFMMIWPAAAQDATLQQIALQKARTLLTAIEGDIQRNGPSSIAPHTVELEQALEDAKIYF